MNAAPWNTTALSQRDPGDENAVFSLLKALFSPSICGAALFPAIKF